MWNDWVHEHKLSKDEFHQSVWVSLVFFCNQVVLLDGLELEETMLKSLFILHAFIVFSGLLDSLVHSVLKDLVPQILVGLTLSEVNLSIWDCGLDLLLNPFFEDEKLENSSSSDISLEVGIIKTIASISESDSCGIDSELFNAIFNSKEVSS
jgi:hypothetical protein